jgi:hypothetical protein
MTTIAEQRRATQTREIPQTVKPALVELRLLSGGSLYAEKGEGKEEGMETDPPPTKMSKKAQGGNP